VIVINKITPKQKIPDSQIYLVIGDMICGTILAGQNLRIENTLNQLTVDETGCTITNATVTITRSDEKSRILLDPTNGIKIQKKVGIAFIDVFSADTSGNLNITGTLTACEIIGGTIAIGSGNNIFKADSNGIYLGNATFLSAPFRVNMAGVATASDLTITGGTITIGSGNDVFKVATEGMWLGHANYADAPFKVSKQGDCIANNLTAGNSLYIGDKTNSVGKGIYFYDNGGITEGLIYSGGTIGLTVITNRGIDLEIGSSYDVSITGVGVGNAGGINFDLTRPFYIRSSSSSTSSILTTTGDLTIGNTLTEGDITLKTSGNIILDSFSTGYILLSDNAYMGSVTALNKLATIGDLPVYSDGTGISVVGETISVDINVVPRTTNSQNIRFQVFGGQLEYSLDGGTFTALQNA
jgi:hypothetical protein